MIDINIHDKYIPDFVIKDIRYFLSQNIHIKKIETNSVIGSYITDSKFFEINKSTVVLNHHGNPYLFGTVDDISLYIDPYMRCDDNRIKFYDDKENIVGIIDKNYNEQNINQERLDILNKIFG